MSTTRKNINRLLKRERIRRNWSQRDLAGIVGVDQSCIAHLEVGDWRPSPALATRIAGVLNVDPRDLFGRDALRKRRLR